MRPARRSPGRARAYPRNTAAIFATASSTVSSLATACVLVSACLIVSCRRTMTPRIAPSASRCEFGSQERDSAISVVDVLDREAFYDKKEVTVTGYYYHEFENAALFESSKAAGSNSAHRIALRVRSELSELSELRVRSERARNDTLIYCHGFRIRVRGTFYAAIRVDGVEAIPASIEANAIRVID